MSNNNFKKTLLMPCTDFPMKANLSQKEIEIELFWKNINLYQKNLNKNKKNNLFLLHDGPPYANGNIHIGHALNKILKDFILRFKTMQGFYTPFIPGWDTHGLPIEIGVLKKKTNNKIINKENFIKSCQEFALNFVEKQKKSFQRLGILGDWENSYLTLNKDFISNQIRIFGKIVEKKLIFKDLKNVYWSPFLNSVLAESEIEYKNCSSFSIFITFKIISKNFFENSKLLVWTTTPWTLPANVAICVNPEKEYYLISTLKDKYIIGKNLLDKLKEKFKWKEIKIIKTFKGYLLENIIYENTLFNKKGKIILDKFVSDQEGTGLVHIAPGHGEEDFLVGKKNNLPILCSVNKNGLMTEISGIYQGIFYEKANKRIIEDLYKNKLILKSETIIHSYPHDERIKKPVICLVIPQWFLNIDKIKDNLLEKIKKIEWIPEWGQVKMNNMIKDRKYWVISRQRTWGVPIPIFYTENNEPILDSYVINHIADLFQKHGIDIWYKWDVKNLLPLNYKNKQSPNNLFYKETDIIDVWFDSGTSYSILQKFSSSFVSSEICLEGADQYRGWFNSSLITSTAAFNKKPYKKIITHGFVLDGSGQKMSKSLNNVVDPLDIIKTKGADILRLWVASINYNIDVRLDSLILKQIEEKYRKIRNILRFMLGNLNNFNPKTNYIILEKRTNFDKIFIVEFYKIIINIIELYEKYNFEKITSLLYSFITNKISSFYLDFIKDILYIEKENNFERRIIQSNIYDMLINLLKILTPIIPHTTSEAYKSMNFLDKKEDIYLESIPKKETMNNIISIFKEKYNQIKNSYELFFKLRVIILKKIEEARQKKIINKSLDIKLILDLPKEYIQVLNDLEIKQKLSQILIVSQIEVRKSKKLKIKIIKAIGHECPRCWNIIAEKKIDVLCNRCNLVLKE
ncbi:isoleucine--tRNA ligase [Candidatus Phytoplasma oryzae]|uniref:Isoleucine--tRNA ligase n=1 Tax=Candidatus Phytoplasma oryzae TaxID=203274 RepID=A0A139JR09_9MOLU|nr:isoleucine--tRNA ligase [Candidatus Phytoplasma oryzae]KXT29402.1 isoleucine--tRNA ligase [Candidatus Phytoplasma oryzae]RAM57985.1 isoleucine--tRNA ligase [Candidatus Phytoplasma oryzae]